MMDLHHMNYLVPLCSSSKDSKSEWNLNKFEVGPICVPYLLVGYLFYLKLLRYGLFQYLNSEGTLSLTISTWIRNFQPLRHIPVQNWLLKWAMTHREDRQAPQSLSCCHYPRQIDFEQNQFDPGQENWHALLSSVRFAIINIASNDSVVQLYKYDTSTIDRCSMR